MLELNSICKIYRTTEIETQALADVSFVVRQGEFLAIMGPSGCGKSTLLSVLGLLDRPSNGGYRFFSQQTEQLPERDLTKLRRGAIGFVFQSFNLIEDLSIRENVEIALLYQGVPRRQRADRVATALRHVDMTHRSTHMPSQLSGGQQQRVAIARAIVSEPRLLLADEPTGNLDTSNGNTVLALLADAAKAGTTVVMVTHSLAHAALATRTIGMLDGRVVSETQVGG